MAMAESGAVIGMTEHDKAIASVLMEARHLADEARELRRTQEALNKTVTGMGRVLERVETTVKHFGERLEKYDDLEERCRDLEIANASNSTVIESWVFWRNKIIGSALTACIVAILSVVIAMVKHG